MPACQSLFLHHGLHCFSVAYSRFTEPPQGLATCSLLMPFTENIWASSTCPKQLGPPQDTRACAPSPERGRPMFTFPNLSLPIFPQLSMSGREVGNPLASRASSRRSASHSGVPSSSQCRSAISATEGISGPFEDVRPMERMAETEPYVELLVLVHGLQGTVEDFTFFHEKLAQSPPAISGRLLVHATDVNTDKTHDGIVEGGTRLAGDILRIAAKYPSLRRISLVGFSLGGVYARYAIGLLFDRDRALVAGLEPSKLITVASPNLGVRNFGVYRYIPQPLLDVATKSFLCKTVEELVLNDGPTDPLLLSMTTDENPDGIPFMSALAAFAARTAYGNLRQDFMVTWGTSIMDASIQGMSGKDLEEAIRTQLETVQGVPIDDGFDQEHCKVAFSYSYPPPVEGRSIVGMMGDENGEPNRPPPSTESVMASRLQSLAWKLVAIDFPSLPVPIAHNRIMAMSRGKVHTWINQAGRRAVLHLVDNVVGDFGDHQPLFERITRDPL